MCNVTFIMMLELLYVLTNKSKIKEKNLLLDVFIDCGRFIYFLNGNKKFIKRGRKQHYKENKNCLTVKALYSYTDKLQST